MQEKKDRNGNFLDRFNKLSVRYGWKIAEACREIGMSRSLFYEIRDGKREVTEKIMGRLKDAEKEIVAADEEKNIEQPANGVEARLARIELLLEALLEKKLQKTSSKDHGKKFS